jgi:hypothetical protein
LVREREKYALGTNRKNNNNNSNSNTITNYRHYSSMITVAVGRGGDDGGGDSDGGCTLPYHIGISVMLGIA